MRPAISLRLTLTAFAVVLLAGCAPAGYVVTAPTPSNLAAATAAPPAPQKLGFVDVRPTDQRVFHTGLLPATLQYGGAPIDPPAFLASQLQAELASRGVPLTVASGDDALPRLDLRTFRIQNHRVSGFSPFVTFTYLSADLVTGPGARRIGVWVKRGKVPVWTFDEIIEPTLNQPLSLAVKELAAKVASQLGGYRSSDQVVADLAAKLATRTESSFLDVYALGFTNNPRALDTLVGLTRDADEYVRLAAISSIGILGVPSQFALLKSLHQAPASALWQDRAMALKAIGDLGTPEARGYLQETLKSIGNANDQDSIWTSQIIGLYL